MPGQALSHPVNHPGKKPSPSKPASSTFWVDGPDAAPHRAAADAFKGRGTRDSALHAPAAGFGDQDFYPDLFDKAAVLTCRLAWNHPLPDGNKRAAWAALVVFVDLNGGAWDPDPPDVDHAAEAMFAVAAHEVDEAWLADWLRERVHFD